MSKVSFNGKWQLVGRKPSNEASNNIIKPNFDSGECMIIEVPGDVNHTLVKYGKMPDPHYDTQGRECYWVTSMEWWYRFDFDAADYYNKDISLCFQCVDSNADIWVNDTYLGEMKNAFREFRFKLNGLLKSHDNSIFLRFKSIDQLLGGPRLDELAGWKERRAYLRKPQFSFGWDWALPIPSIGLEGDVWIEVDNFCYFAEHSIQTFQSGRIDLAFEVSKAAKEKGYAIALAVNGFGTQVSKTISRDSYKSYVSVCVPDPKLWYPNGFGEQNRYDFQIELIVDGQVCDTRKGKLGIRESRIVEKPFTDDAGPGFSFEVEINGNCVFCKGGNWIPLELWPGTIKPEQYEFYITKAREAGFNMLRVWGGGIYESDVFYDLCDKNGIMVWQDFMFASEGYPVNLLRDEITAEAEYQIKRLRNHPCIVLWCGCNEDVYSWSYPNDEETIHQSDVAFYKSGKESWEVNRIWADPQIYTMILRGLVGKNGLGAPYIESSPQSRDDNGNLPNSGNCHISCWKYIIFDSNDTPGDFRKHFEQVCSFNSEFCIQGPCSVEAFKKFIAPENLWSPNDAWIYHIQRGHSNVPHHERTVAIAGAIFGEIDTLQKYVKFGQAFHAEMMRAEFESARRDRTNNGGTMMWMYNDCWPTSNWSIIDYYRQPKPSYYAAKRACAPLLPILFERNEKMEYFFANDTNEDAEIDVEYGHETMLGERCWSRKQKFVVQANSVIKFNAIARADLKVPYGDFLYIRSKANGLALPTVSYFPDLWRCIKWPEPSISVNEVRSQETYAGWDTVISVQTDAFARFCHLLYAGSKKDGVFLSDNYFDLPTGENHEVIIQSVQKVDVQKIKIGHWLTDWE